MQLSMQQRDALLAGLALLGMGMENGSIVVDRSNPKWMRSVTFLRTAASMEACHAARSDNSLT